MRRGRDKAYRLRHTLFEDFTSFGRWGTRLRTEVLLNRSNTAPIPNFREPEVRKAKSTRTPGSAAGEVTD